MIIYTSIILALSCLCRCANSDSSFNDITLFTSSSQLKESITFTLEFVLNRDFADDEAFVFRLPRFFGDSATNLKMSPSILLESAWVQGQYLNYTDIDGLGGLNDISSGIPFDTSELIVKLKDTVSFTNQTRLSISIYESNNIGVYCGMPSSDTYYSAEYQSRLFTDAIETLPLMGSKTVESDGSLGAFTSDFVPFRSFPTVGSDGFNCSYLNYCSGHGVCDYCNQQCVCDDGYGKASDLVPVGSAYSFAALSCAARTCPVGKAVSDLPTSQTRAHAHAECSNQGRCNRNTGACTCYPPFEGDACNEMTCPTSVQGGVCSGHGVCWTMAEIAASDAIAAATVYGDSSKARASVAWDNDMIRGCVCNSSWTVGYGASEYQLGEYYLPDCSLRRCPSGDNPYTCEDEEDCEGISQTGGVQVGAAGNKCHQECSNRGFCNRNNGTCSCFEGSTGPSCNMVTSGELPACLPTGQPSSSPTNTFTPTGQPSGQPTSTPSSFPTGVLYLPMNITGCTLVNNSATRESVRLNCSLDVYAFDAEALVYCAPYAVLTNPDTGVVTRSLPNNADDIIRFQQYAQSFGGMAFVDVKNLAPTTRYDFYCASVTKVLIKSPIQDILKSEVLDVDTVCCKIVTVDLQSQPLTEGSFRLNGLGLTISHLPSWDVTIDVVITNFFNPADAHVLSNITTNPTAVAVGNTEKTLLQYGLDVISEPGSVDFTYQFNAVVSGTSASEYIVQYTNLHAITIVAADVVPAVPQLEVAQFSSDGGSVIVDFDSFTDQGLYGNGVFACPLVLSFAGSADSHCQWASAQRIIITPAIDVLPNVTTVSVVGSLIKAECTDNPAFPCSTWGYVLTDPIVIGYPVSPVVPSVVVMGPSVLNSCSDLVLDIGSASTGSAGRDWLYSRPSFSLRSTTAVAPADLMAFLNTNFVMLPPSPVNASLLEVGASYTIGVTLCNFFDSCGTTEYYLFVSENTEVPTINILGTPFRTIKAKDAILLNTNVHKALCNNEISFAGLDYTWSIWPGGRQTLTGGVIVGTQSFTIVSTSPDETKYALPAYTLTPSSFYSIYIAVADDVTGDVIETFVTVTVTTGDIITKIAGGSDLYIRYGESITLDGSDSYDEDLGPVAAIDGSTREGLMFEWTCVGLTPVYGGACPYSFNTADASGPEAFQLTMQSLFVSGVASSTYLAFSAKILLTVSDMEGSRSTDAQVVLSTIESLAPVININKNSIMNPIDTARQMVISAYISSTYDCMATWSFNESTVALSTIAATNISTVVYRNTPKQVFLAVHPFVLGTRFTYLFSLSCSPHGPPNVNISTPLGPASAIIVTTNGPPQFGTFSTSPASGGVALATRFQFLALQWLDEELPLSFEFGFLGSQTTQSKKTTIKAGGADGKALFDKLYSPVRSETEVAYGSSILPPGTVALGYQLTTVARVYDALGYAAVRYNDVEVLSYASQHSSGTSGSGLNNATVLLNLLSAASPISSNFSSAAAALSFIDVSKQVLAVFSDTVNSVNCTLAPDCDVLHRDSCGQVSHTCGECFNGTVGTAGNGNTPCLAEDDTLLTDPSAQATMTSTSCTTDSDCGGWYICGPALLCTVASKKCHNNCSTEHGECSYIHTATAVRVSTCLASDDSCSAVCTCADGYSGSDCSFGSYDFESVKEIRKILLSKLSNLTQVEAPVPSALASWAATAAAIASVPSEMSNTSASLVYSTAEKIIATAKDTAVPYTAIIPVLSAIDSSMEYTTIAYPVTVTSSHDVFKVLGLGDQYAATLNVSLPLIQSFIDMVVAVAVPGQSAVESIFNTFRVSSVAVPDELVNVFTTTANPTFVETVIPDAQLTVPQTALEKRNGLVPSAMSVASDQFYLSDSTHGARRRLGDSLTMIGPLIEDPSNSNSSTSSSTDRRLATSSGAQVESNGLVNTGGAMAMISVRIQQYGGVDRQFNSNPITIQVINIKDLESASIRLTTINEEPEEFETRVSNLTYTTVCTPFKPETFIYPCTLDYPDIVHVCEDIEDSIIYTSSCVTVVQLPTAINIVGVDGQTNNDGMRVPKREAAIANGTSFPPTSECSLVSHDSMTTVSNCSLASMVNYGPISPEFSAFTRRRRLAAGATTASGAVLPVSEQFYPMVAMKQSTIHPNFISPFPVDDTLSPAPLVYVIISVIFVASFVVCSIIILKFEFYRKFNHVHSQVAQKEIELAKVVETKQAKASARAHTSALASHFRGASTAAPLQAATELAAKKAKQKAKQKLKLAIKEYMNHILPPVFRIYPSYWISTSVGHWFARRKLEDIYTQIWKIVVELYNHHRYVRCIRTPHTAAEKTRNFVSVMYAFSVVTMILLLGVIFYELDAGPDDGSCKHYFDEQSCIARKSRMNRDKDYCEWIERSYLNSATIEVCVYNDITFNNITSTYTGVIIAVLLGIYQAILEIPYRVLTAQTADVELYEAAELVVNKNLNVIVPFSVTNGQQSSEDEFINASTARSPPKPQVMERLAGLYERIKLSMEKFVLRFLLLLYSNDGRNASKKYGSSDKTNKKHLRMGVDDMSSVVNKLNEHLDSSVIRRKSWVGEVSAIAEDGGSGVGSSGKAGHGSSSKSASGGGGSGKADDTRAASSTNTDNGNTSGSAAAATGVGSPGYSRKISTIQSPVVMLSTPLAPHRAANRLKTFMKPGPIPMLDLSSTQPAAPLGEETLANSPAASKSSKKSSKMHGISTTHADTTTAGAVSIISDAVGGDGKASVLQPVVFNFLPNDNHDDIRPLPSAIDEHRRLHENNRTGLPDNVPSVGVFTFMDQKPVLPPTPPEEVELLPQSLSDFMLYNTGLKDLSSQNIAFGRDVTDARSKMLCYYYIHNTPTSGIDTNIEDQITTLEHITEVFNKAWISKYDRKTRRFARDGLKPKGIGAMGGGAMGGALGAGLMQSGGRSGRGKRNSVMGGALLGLGAAVGASPTAAVGSEYVNYEYDQLLKDIQSQYEALQQLYYTISSSRALVMQAYEAAIADNSDSEHQSEHSDADSDVEDLEERRERMEEEIRRLDEDETDATKKIYGFLEVWHLVLQKIDAEAVRSAKRMKRKKNRKRSGGNTSQGGNESDSSSSSGISSSGSSSSSSGRETETVDEQNTEWQDDNAVCVFGERSQLKLRKLLLHTQELLQEKVQLLSSIIDGSSSMWAAADAAGGLGVATGGDEHQAATVLDTLGHGHGHSHSPTKHHAKLDNLTTGDGGESGRIGIGVGVELMHLFIMDLLGSISVVDSGSIVHSRQASRDSDRPGSAESATARIMDEQAATLKNHIITTNRNASNPSVNPITRVFEMKVQEDFMQVYTVTMSSKIMSTLAFIIVNAACLAYVVMRASVRQERWQVMFGVACVVQFIMECFIYETLVVLIVHFWLPSIITHQKIKPIYNLITELMLDLFDHDFEEHEKEENQKQGQDEAGPGVAAVHTHDLNDEHDDVSVYGDEANHIQRSNEPNAVPVKVNVPSYLYISTMLAQQFTHLLESQIILSFETYRPNAELSSKWDDNHFDWALEAKEIAAEERDKDMEKWYRDHEYTDFDEHFDEDEDYDDRFGNRIGGGGSSGKDRRRGRGHRHTLFTRRPVRSGRNWFSRMLHFFDCSYKAVVKHASQITVFPVYKAHRYTDHRLVKGRELPLGEYYSLSMLLLWGLFQCFGVAKLSIAHMTSVFKVVVPVLLSLVALCYTRNMESANIAIFVTLFLLHFAFYRFIQNYLRKLGYRFLSWFKAFRLALYPYSKHVYRWSLQGAMFVAWIIRRILRAGRKYYRYCCDPQPSYGSVAPALPTLAKERPGTASSDDSDIAPRPPRGARAPHRGSGSTQEGFEREFLSSSEEEDDEEHGAWGADDDGDSVEASAKPIAGFNMDSDSDSEDDDEYHQEFSFKHSENDEDEDEDNVYAGEKVGNWGGGDDSSDDDEDDDEDIGVLESSVEYSPNKDGPSPWKSPPPSISAEEHKRRIEMELEAEYNVIITGGTETAKGQAMQPPPQPQSPAAAPRHGRKVIKPPDTESIIEDDGHIGGTNRLAPPAGQHPYPSTSMQPRPSDTIALNDFASPEPMSQSFASSTRMNQTGIGVNALDVSVVSDMKYSGALNKSYDSSNDSSDDGTPRVDTSIQVVDFTPQRAAAKPKPTPTHQPPMRIARDGSSDSDSDSDVSHVDYSAAASGFTPQPHGPVTMQPASSSGDGDSTPVPNSISSGPNPTLAGTNPWNGNSPAVTATRGGFSRPQGEIKERDVSSRHNVIGHSASIPSIGDDDSSEDGYVSDSQDDDDDDERTLRTLESPIHIQEFNLDHSDDDDEDEDLLQEENHVMDIPVFDFAGDDIDDDSEGEMSLEVAAHIDTEEADEGHHIHTGFDMDESDDGIDDD